MATINEELENLFNHEIHALGFVLVGLELEGQNSNKLLRVYVDNFKAEDINSTDTKGVTVEDCSKISRHLNKFISVLPNFKISNYVLEVSSPGVERRLFKLSDFTEHLNKEVRLRLRLAVEGKVNISGLLLEVDCKLNKIFVEIDKQRICLDYDNISKANLVYRKF